MKVRLQYADGIDKAKGSVSTKLDESERDEFIAGLTTKQRKELSTKKLSDWTPGEILAERRRRVTEEVAGPSNAKERITAQNNQNNPN